jgi:hypothetical protein
MPVQHVSGSYGNNVTPPLGATVFWFCGGGIPGMLLTPGVAFGNTGGSVK